MSTKKKGAAPTQLLNYLSPGEVLHVAHDNVESYSSLKISFLGIEVHKIGKKLTTNTFYSEEKLWGEGSERMCSHRECPFQDISCAAFLLPLTLPPSCFHKNLGVETFYQIKIEASCKDGKKIPAFEDNVVLVTRAPEVTEAPSKLLSKAGQMGRSVVEQPPGAVPLTLEFSVEKNVYAFGEPIKINLYIDNDSEEEVTGITFSLLQLWIIESSGTKESNVIVQEKFNTGFPLSPGKTLKESFQLQVPPARVDCPPTVRGGTLFRVEYTLQGQVSFQIPKSISPVARVPVILFSLSNSTQLVGDDWSKLYSSGGDLQRSKGFIKLMKSKFSR